MSVDIYVDNFDALGKLPWSPTFERAGLGCAHGCCAVSFTKRQLSWISVFVVGAMAIFIAILLGAGSHESVIMHIIRIIPWVR
jgi:hypothetical protein